MTDAEKAEIDGQSYEQLLHRWRFAPLGAELFQGEKGDYYYSKVMFAKRDALPHKDQVAASKIVGWGSPLFC